MKSDAKGFLDFFGFTLLVFSSTLIPVIAFSAHVKPESAIIRAHTGHQGNRLPASSESDFNSAPVAAQRNDIILAPQYDWAVAQ